ncbi:MAG TPA: hypothetical protein VFC63_03620 [Blastocatellia bacterium]|nr:hypothetical protein [Blastocatellia bacterium]
MVDSLTASIRSDGHTFVIGNFSKRSVFLNFEFLSFVTVTYAINSNPTVPEKSMTRLAKLDWTIVAGSILFIVILLISAYWDRTILWLHIFQSGIYLAIILLSVRHSRWGYFIGIAISAFWNMGSLCVTSFFHSGRVNLQASLATGHLVRPDQIIAVPAVLISFLLIICCIWAYARIRNKRFSDVVRFLTAAVVTVGYFALIMFLFQPRYLGMFPRMLHPHLNY